jgi:hypothetical protein
MVPAAVLGVATQQPLTAANMPQFVARNHALLEILGGSEGLKVEELLDGVINMVYRGGCDVSVTPSRVCHKPLSAALLSGNQQQQMHHSSRASTPTCVNACVLGELLRGLLGCLAPSQ